MRQVSGGWADGGAGAHEGSDARNLVNFLSRGWRPKGGWAAPRQPTFAGGPELLCEHHWRGSTVSCCSIEKCMNSSKCRVYFPIFLCNACISRYDKVPVEDPTKRNIRTFTSQDELWEGNAKSPEFHPSKQCWEIDCNF